MTMPDDVHVMFGEERYIYIYSQSDQWYLVQTVDSYYIHKIKEESKCTNGCSDNGSLCCGPGLLHGQCTAGASLDEELYKLAGNCGMNPTLISQEETYIIALHACKYVLFIWMNIELF